MRSLAKRKNSSHNAVQVQERKIVVEKNFGGLGKRYFELLSNDIDKIMQVDVTSGVTESRGSVKTRSMKLAGEMRRRNIKKGDIVVLCSRTHPDQVVVVLAALFIGAIVAPLDPLFSYREVSELMRDLKPKMCFGDARTIPQFDRIFQALNMTVETVNLNTDQAGTVQFRKLLMRKEDDNFQPIYVENPSKDIAFVLPTQGTTDLPKLICLSHANIVAQTSIFFDILGTPEKIISFFPISWFLQMIIVCVSFETPITRILPGLFTERNACKIIHDFKIGYGILGTDFAMKIINSSAFRDFNLSCLKAVIIGTVNTTKFDIMTLKNSMPDVKFLQCYCLTETGCIASTTVLNYQKSLTKPLAIGTVTTNTRIKIVDVDSRKTLGPNNWGEIYYDGDGLMLGYLKDAQRTKYAMDKNFFMTGDFGMIDDDGWLYVRGRIDDFIETNSGSSFCPLDVEEVILRHPQVQDVVVIGNSKEIIAIVKKKNPDLALPPQRLMQFLADRCPEHQRPTNVIYMEHFPRTSIGNVLKRVLRKDYLEIHIHYTSSDASVQTVDRTLFLRNRDTVTSEITVNTSTSSIVRSFPVRSGAAEVAINMLEELFGQYYHHMDESI